MIATHLPYSKPSPVAFLGKFAIIGRLGVGESSRVYDALNTENERRIALKVPRYDVLGDAEAAARVSRTVRALSAINHPGVVSICNHGIIRDLDYVSFPFIDGFTLAVWMRAVRHRWRDVVPVFLELARALTAVHAAGFTHGDLHPGNVLIDWFSQVTLIGFGLSRALSDSATRGADAPSAAQDDATNATNATRCSASSMALLFPMTTHAAAYIAPERHLGALGDERADQFSFCAMLYEALWGTRPFAGDNAENALASMCGAPFAAPPAPEIPTAVRRAVRRGLLVDAADRFESMEALCEILASAIAT